MLPLFAQFELTRPAWLLALVVVPLILYFAWRTKTMMLVWQRICSTVCRTAIVVLLVLAAAHPVYRAQTGRQFVMFVADGSPSASRSLQQQFQPFVAKAVSRQGDGDLVGFVAFAGEAVRVDTAERMPPPDGQLLLPLQSNPADALLYAVGLVPEGCVPKIVLLTDAIQTDGDLFTAAQGIHVPVDVVPLAPFRTPEVSVDGMLAPPHARPNVPFTVEVVIRSNRATRATVRLTPGRDQLVQQEVDLVAGENRVRFSRTLLEEPAGVFNDTVFTATVSDDSDDILENNRRRAVVVAAAPPLAMIVADNPGSAQPMREALAAAGFKVAPLQRTAERLASARVRSVLDLVAILDMPPSSLPAGVATNLKDFVADGGGLIVMGGRTTFAADVFAESPIEPLTPVRALKRREERPPAVAMVLVIDKSSSMRAEERLELAKEAAKKTVGLLSERDKVGVLVFGDESSWISDLAPLTDRPLVLRRIDALQPGGITNMYTALEKAYLALEQTDADRRHAIVLTDGVPSPGDYDRLARAMAKAGIAVSTVTVGSGADQTIMRDIARLAGGQHNHCDDPEELPNLFRDATLKATQIRAPTGIRPMIVRTFPGLDVSSAPQLLDYAATVPKPPSEVLMVTPDGDPLLSWWRYRRGVVVAMTSSGQRWRAWDGFRAFAALLAKHAIPQNELSDDVVVRWDQQGQQVTLRADARDADGSFVNNAAAVVELSVTDDDTTNHELPQSAPGRYEDVFRLNTFVRHDFEINVTKDDRRLHQARRAVFADYPDELRLGAVNESLLRDVARVTGGKFDPQPEEIFADDGRRVDQAAQWWTLPLMVALVIFVIDVWLRRARFTAKTASDQGTARD
jgi:Mg-chelatase subunit ChlD